MYIISARASFSDAIGIVRCVCKRLNIFFSILHSDHRSEDFYRNFGVLPTSETCERIKEEFVFLVARSIVSYLPAFEPLKNHVPRHIIHPFVKEMSQKSTVVPLGLIFENENTSFGIAKIIREIQDKYVPMIVEDDKKRVSLTKLFFIVKFYKCVLMLLNGK